MLQTIEALAQAAGFIARGGVIAFRTDTLYGLGADPFNRNAVRKIKELKGRAEHKPILIVISDREQLPRFIEKPSATFDLITKRFWPGPLTLTGKANPELPLEIPAGSGTVGIRLPADAEVCSLIRACGGALTATSANPANCAPARTAEDVAAYFGESIDLIVDGGAAQSDQPSTVVAVGEKTAELIREGVVPWSQIQDILSPQRS